MPPTPKAGADAANAARLLSQGKAGEAAQIYAALLAGQPTNSAHHFNLACALQAANNIVGAITHYLAALQIQPNLVSAANNLGNALMGLGRAQEAMTYFRQALAHDQDHANALVCLGGLLLDGDGLSEAHNLLRHAVVKHPQNFNAHILLSQACDRLDLKDEADTHLAKAIALRPNDANVRNNLGTRLLRAGQVSEAIAEMKKAVALDPASAALHSNLILARLYAPEFTAADHLAEARSWNERHGKPRTATARARARANGRSPDRRLKIGYVSADFYQHPVGFFMNGPLARHDRTQFEIFCYSNGRTDDYTDRLKHPGDTWRDVRRLSDDDLFKQIRTDGIDILVDLAGHTASNRLPLFAMRPAPIQITGGGHTGTTGLDAIDYLIADRFEAPDAHAKFYCETLLRMPSGYVCYTPPDYAPAVGPLPLDTNGYVTFCCHNNIAKLNGDVIALWARILNECPDARLSIEARPLRQNPVADRLRTLFAAHGIAADRLDLGGGEDHSTFLNVYNRADIALDPFPYSGGLTTLESLWMGVPVVTRPGDQFAARHSLSHLGNLGLTELIAQDDADYVRIASDLAREPGRLRDLRRNLRDRMATSPLTDAAAYTRALEAAYRDVWRKWCGA